MNRALCNPTIFMIGIIECTIGILFISFIFLTPLVQAQEIGFVALSEGYADYEHLGEKQKAISSFFLVNLLEEYNISLGAIILNSHQQFGENRSEQLDVDTDVYEIELDNIRHTAWGTLLAYSISNESFFGLQGWAGVGYLSNTLEFEGKTVSLYKYSDNTVQLCELSLDGKSGEVKSFPFFIGIGFSVWGFGLFAQYMEQHTDPLKLDVTVSDKCSTIVGGHTFSDTFKESYKEEIKSSFSLFSTGIQYRF